MGVQRGAVNFLGSNIYSSDGEVQLLDKRWMDGIDLTP